MNAKPRSYLVAGLIGAVVMLALVWLLFRVAGIQLIKTTRGGIPLADSVPSLPVDAHPTHRPENIIVVIADGLGFSHLAAARVVNHGIRAPVAWDRFEAFGWHHPHPVKGLMIDSAASATALATGMETRYGVMGIDAEGQSLTSLFEKGHQSGYRLGVVTDAYIWDATPAAFVVESDDRDDAAGILQQLAASELEVLFGELEDVGEGEVPEKEPTLELLKQRFVLLDESLQGPPPPTPVAMVVDEDAIGDLDSHPTLPDMAGAAISRLNSNDRPFLLLVESEEADAASHDNDFARVLAGMEALVATLTLILDFAEEDGSTLVLFTSDHETGGLALTISDNTNLNLKALWSTVNHTGEPVPVMAYGPGAEHFAGIHSTAQLGQILDQLLQE